MTALITPTLTTFDGESKSVLERAIEGALQRAEAAERGLAIDEGEGNIADRLATGSFYTPIDVVHHFWREYADFHGLGDLPTIRSHFAETTFVEPSVGAGVFLFGLLKYAASAGCTIDDFRTLKFVAIDVNRSAVTFLENELSRLEAELGIAFDAVKIVHADFLEFTFELNARLSFVGNPPYVRNGSRSRWKNLYADFIERMLDTPAIAHSLSLIVPISIAFSRDYASLRRRLSQSRAVRMESFDNIPDCLFKAGKPGNTNTNKANSQRCCILTVRDFGPALKQSTSLQRWARGDREAFLKSPPQYIDFEFYSFDGQIPRPSQAWVLPYLKNHADDLTLGDLCALGSHRLAVASVSRNFIGIREPDADEAGAIHLAFQSSVHFAWALQILSSPIFYEYWRSLGDGFHVTRSDILRFPISARLLSACNASADRALSLWRRRSEFSRSKLNAGKEIVSYDFRREFAGLLDVIHSQDMKVEVVSPEILPTRQSMLPGFMLPAE